MKSQFGWTLQDIGMYMHHTVLDWSYILMETRPKNKQKSSTSLSVVLIWSLLFQYYSDLLHVHRSELLKSVEHILQQNKYT